MEEYNGWSGYETWLVNLWLTNEPGSYEASREVAANGAEAIKDLVEDWTSEGIEPSSMVADLLGAALSRVNWREIAESLIED